MMELNEDQIDIVSHQEPTDFYEELRRLIGNAKQKLLISALYLGSGKKEMDLLSDVSSALEENPDLTVLFILDHSRARRGEKSSIHLLSPLVDKYYPRIQVCFYQMPQLKSAPYNWLPYWLQEVVAVYHCKFCVSDSTVLISGANLSHDYFTDRQDRYWTIRNTNALQNSNPMDEQNGTAPLVQYLRDFSRAVAKDSWILSPGNTQLKPPELSTPALREFLHNQDIFAGSGTKQSKFDGNSRKVLFAYPIVQHAGLFVENERNFFLRLLKPQNQDDMNSIIPSNMHLRQVQLCTPYTNFPKSLCQGLRAVSTIPHHQSANGASTSSVHVQIIGPSARCHGFAGGKGFKEELPFLHEAALHARLFARSRRDKKLKQDHNIEWRQYDRAGWTLHRKGLWLGYSTDDTNHRPVDQPHTYNGNAEEYTWATYIGSSNFGERSWRRDLELGFFFLEKPNTSTKNKSCGPLQRVLQSESKDLVNTSHLYHYHPRHTIRTDHYQSHASIDRHEDQQPLLSSTNTNLPSQNSYSTNKARSNRFHIRALAWILRSVL